MSLEELLDIVDIITGSTTIASINAGISILESLNLTICTDTATPYCLDIDGTDGSCCAVISVDQTCLSSQISTDLTAVISNGTPPYTYEWSDGTTTTTINTLQRIYVLIPQVLTNYSVTITDDNNCVTVAEITLMAPNAGTVQAPSTSSFCNFSPAATSIPSTAVTGATDYTFLITNSQQLANNGDPILMNKQ